MAGRRSRKTTAPPNFGPPPPAMITPPTSGKQRRLTMAFGERFASQTKDNHQRLEFNIQLSGQGQRSWVAECRPGFEPRARLPSKGFQPILGVECASFCRFTSQVKDDHQKSRFKFSGQKSSPEVEGERCRPGHAGRVGGPPWGVTSVRRRAEGRPLPDREGNGSE
ncbi:Hypp235 [Branchiostoma lanceolatum]|uniref:Hypp235 protein n=1 Tax=Branchiostoma lanceolatum TaxID=7740 RepID=A0A8J9YIE5_BRALA|nr:Hypp235 [Branchiostoma lanceolatum]